MWGDVVFRCLLIFSEVCLAFIVRVKQFLYPEDWSRTFLRNIGVKTYQTTWRHITASPSWEPQISDVFPKMYVSCWLYTYGSEQLPLLLGSYCCWRV
jgi:hypothetical protein